MKTRIVIVDDDTGEPLYDAPKSNNRLFKIELHNRGRVQHGTATMYRLTALYEGIGKRYGRVWKSSKKHDFPIIIRRQSRVGPVVVRVDDLPGPVASVATKH